MPTWLLALPSCLKLATCQPAIHCCCGLNTPPFFAKPHTHVAKSLLLAALKANLVAANHASIHLRGITS